MVNLPFISSPQSTFLSPLAVTFVNLVSELKKLLNSSNFVVIISFTLVDSIFKSPSLVTVIPKLAKDLPSLLTPFTILFSSLDIEVISLTP